MYAQSALVSQKILTDNTANLAISDCDVHSESCTIHLFAGARNAKGV
jgi:hypothetical protein